MVKGQDILVLLKLLQEPESWTVRSLAQSVAFDPAGVHRALRRLQDARLVDPDGKRVNRSNAQEFLVHGVKYLFPVQRGGPSRGVPTAWAASPLKNELAAVDEPPPVWPDPKGKARGISLEPLHASVPELARRDGELAEALALIDAIRLGNGRIRSLASKRLSERVSDPKKPR